MTTDDMCRIAEAVPETQEPPLVAIYKTNGPGSRDEYAGSVYAMSAAQALETFALTNGIDSYSLDEAAGRVFLCPPMMRTYFYAYAD